MFDEMWQEIQDMPGEIFDYQVLDSRDFDDNFTAEDYERREYEKTQRGYWCLTFWSALLLELCYQLLVSIV